MLVVMIGAVLINIAALLMFLGYIQRSDIWYNYFVYPIIIGWLDKEDVGSFGKWFICILLTLFFLPAFIVYYFMLLLCLVVALISYWVLTTFDKIRRKDK